MYLQSGAYGVDVARRYREIEIHNLYEAAVIAGLLKAPSRYSPLRSRTAAEKRARIVLEERGRREVLDDKTAQKIGSQRLRARSFQASPDSALFY